MSLVIYLRKTRKGNLCALCYIAVRLSSEVESITTRKSAVHLSKLLIKFTVDFKITTMFNPDICIEICPLHIFIWLNNFSHNKDVLVK